MKPNDKQDTFFQVPRISKKTTLGDVALPMFFQDASNVIAVFRANEGGVAHLLEGSGLRCALSLAGKPLVFISLYEYRDSSVGAYNEVGIAIPVLPDGVKKPVSNFADLLGSTDDSRVGWHIVNLPVTTEQANAAGKEIWGYPKFVAQIPFTLDRHSFRSEVKDPQGDSIMRLAGKLHFGINAPALSGITYSHLNKKILRATVNARGDYKAHLAHQLRLKIGSSAHNMAENLRALGLDNARPATVLACHNFQSRLSDGFEFAM